MKKGRLLMQNDPHGPSLLDALRAAARGSATAEAAINLISDAGWLERTDFTDRFIIWSDGLVHARVQWAAAIEAVDRHDLLASDTASALLRVAASYGAGVRVNLQDIATAPDDAAIGHLPLAVRVGN